MQNIATIKRRQKKIRKFYIHGPSRDKEAERLYKQAEHCKDFLLKDIDLAKYLKDTNKPFIEIGCGVGAQTTHLLEQIPENIILRAIDIDPNQIKRAQYHLSKFKKFQGRYLFEVGDVTSMELEQNAFSGAYICWVLEHLKYSQALKLMKNLKKIIEPGGVVIINEIMMQPDKYLTIKTTDAIFPLETKKAFLKLIEKQEIEGGNPNMGAYEHLSKLLKDSGVI